MHPGVCRRHTYIAVSQHASHGARRQARARQAGPAVRRMMSARSSENSSSSSRDPRNSMPGCVESTHKGYNLHDPMLPPPSRPSAEDTGNGDARRWVRGTIAPVLREGRTLRPSMPSDVHSGSPAHGALVQRPPPFRARGREERKLTRLPACARHAPERRGRLPARRRRGAAGHYRSRPAPPRDSAIAARGAGGLLTRTMPAAVRN